MDQINRHILDIQLESCIERAFDWLKFAVQRMICGHAILAN